MSISSYNTLKTKVADWLLRTDLTDVIPTFIDNAESVLKRDSRVRTLLHRDLTLSAHSVNLPSDFKAPESLYLDGPTYFGEIDIVSAGQLGDVERRLGETGVPRYAAYLGSTLRLAPVPDDSYTARLVYWATITHLGDNVQSNWLLAEHPDIYLYATLVESAPYLADDARVETWGTLLERRLNELDLHVRQKHYGGSLVQRPSNHIP